MTLNEYKIAFKNQLAHIYPEQEALSILQILCEDLLNWSRTDFLFKNKEALTHLQREILDKSLEKLMQHEPVQHITGIAHFFGEQFKVSQDTLVPRQETEELVDWIIKDHQKLSPKTIMDIGTGTGCIGLSLGLAFAKAQISLADVSKMTLEITKKNAANLHLVERIKLVQIDILRAESIPEADIIVSNPPYVRDMEKVEIQKNVLDYEPHLALFVSDDDPLIFYRKIMQLALPSLQNGGLLYFEINQYLSDEMKSLASDLGLTFELKKDLNGNWRMMKCWL
ncbi:protein-(glutamine-N5) methyltransferase, release factor-specific [Nonlabens spongiae]|uniref:peptide chain release factor N(5)-glutamine methyltransferase n=1 Tax=Nonlabens spongiae TaxID=331648 RepID=A0A1W6MK43_9FLAO|nr:peptide chain release factor N(5)-glutamine methyltransferase [Nonlabens spongiae]ARN77839.1 protein-(glutamine-N5) methyltransferase, release factor-specific [Nonlabens spongiae]